MRRGAREGHVHVMAVLGLAVSLYTLLTLSPLIPPLVIELPRGRLALEAAGLVITILTSALAYFHYALEGSRTWLLIAVGFAVISVNQLVFGVLTTLPGSLPLFFWMAARLLVAMLLVPAAFSHAGRQRAVRRPLRSFVVATTASLAVLATAETVLWSLRASLPATDPDAALSTAAADIIPFIAIPSVIAAAAYLVAALSFARRNEPPNAPWLPPALVLAGFSHLHYTLFPTVFTEHISSGDILRLVFFAVLLTGLIGSLRRTQLMERERARYYAEAYLGARQHAHELERLDRAKVQLFGVMAHELMHPVAAIRGFALTLRRRWEELDDATRVEVLGHLEQQSDQLRQLAEEAAEALRTNTERVEVTPERRPVRELVEDAAAGFPQLRGRLSLQVDASVEDAHVRADRSRIQQVFGNLLSNAVKYSGADTPVEVAAERVDGEVRFTVRDHGRGITREQMADVFKPFARAEDVDDIAGSGLGLYISRRVIDAHGGRIWVESEPGEGSAFRFTLPVVEGTA